MKGTPFEFFWLPKEIQVGDAGWMEAVIQNKVCPNQRKYRRLTWSERLAYERGKNEIRECRRNI